MLAGEFYTRKPTETGSYIALPERHRLATRDRVRLSDLKGELFVSGDSLQHPGGDRRVDRIVVVSAPRDVQMHRIRARRRMSNADIEAVIARQMPDAEKRRRADVVIRTGLSRHASLVALRKVIREVLG